MEQLEPRHMMALSILSVSPLDNAIEVPVDANLVITFNEAPLKGQGNIYVVRDSTGTEGVAVDVNSTNVTISGNQVTIDLPSNLLLDNGYSVRIDNGAFLDTSAGVTAGTTLFTQNFEYENLGPSTSPSETGGDGTDFTLVPPLGMTVDNSTLGAGGVPEWSGWSFANKDFWVTSAGNQDRSLFTLGQGTVAITDPDEWDDSGTRTGLFNSFLTTRPINLTDVAAGSVKLEFDSSFRAEGAQLAKVEISYNGGAFSDLQTFLANDGINSHIVIDSTTALNSIIGGGTVVGALNSPASGTMQFRFSMNNAGNNWWWAIDNVKVTGDRVGAPFAGISNATQWNFSTPAALALSMSIAPGKMGENGGTAVGTITRNKQFENDLIVTLSSNDTSEATVPATVTILAGQASATFPITAVDDTLSDRLQTVLISATSATYGNASATIQVTDDEGPKIVSLVPVDNTLTGVDYRSDFLITFDVAVKKGNGLINIVRASDNIIVDSVNVTTTAVTLEGGDLVARINPSIDLPAPDSYYVLIDDGTFLDTTTNVTPNTVLLMQDFEGRPLSPLANGEAGGDGTDISDTPPPRFTRTNTFTGNAGSSNWDGWTVADKNAWVKTDTAGRGQFSAGVSTVAVADPNRWGAANPAVFNSFLTTTAIPLTGLAANSVAIEFDSSYQGGLPQKGELQVSYNGGSTWVALLDFDSVNNRNAHIRVDTNVTVGTRIGGGIVRNKLQNPTSGNLQFRFNVINALTQGWFAVDNIRVTGQTVGVPFQGISDPTTWNFSVERPTLQLSIDRTTMSENGGTAIGTVTRNLSTASDLVVTLTSGDTSEATVPATVTIPAGQASATFPITAVDDAIVDGIQNVTFTATALPEFISANASMSVLDISFTPPDNSTAIAVNTNLVVNFDADIAKGNGTIQIVRKSDNVRVMSIDVNSAVVTVAGSTLTINPPQDLKGLTEYYILVDPGAILYLPATATPGVTLLKEDFEHLALGPAVIGPGFNANGKDFTATPPTGFAVDNSQMPPGGVPEFYGWTFMDKAFWLAEGGQDRNAFTRGSGTIAIGDTDEWDDVSRPNNSFNSIFSTRGIDLSKVDPLSVTLEFDSSFRPESFTPGDPPVVPPDNQIGVVEVSYDDGATWAQLEQLDALNTSEDPASTNVNERKSITVPNPATGTIMKFRFGLTGTNDYWWAIDNIEVKGSALGTGFGGIADPTSWNFTTADVPTLSLSIPAATIAENGGVATATVSRNLGTSGALVVNLTSSDPLLATVPATVTIPNGQASVTFPITAVDDTVVDGLKSVTVTASAAGFVSGAGSQGIADNEVANLKITEIMYNPAGSEPRTEYLEVVNLGTTSADLSGWSFDDEDTTNWGAIPAGTLLEPGKVAVFYNSFFGQNTDTIFRTEWAVPADSLVVGIFWGVLDNGPSATDEVLTLIDGGKLVVDTVNFDDDGTVWPGAANGRSIAMKRVTLNNDVGTNWINSVVGTGGARNPIAAAAVYNVADVGSPGTIPPIDTTAPTVTRVIASGVFPATPALSWEAAFIDTLDGGGVGAGNGLGFEIVAGGASLPWSNVNRLFVQFSENVGAPTATNLELRVSPLVAANAGVVPTVISYNPTTFLATLELAAPLEFGKYRIAVGQSVTDESGNGLDGDASGAAGGIFDLRFNVVPGDTNNSGNVSAADVGVAYGTSFGQLVTAPTFNPRVNWNGVGRVTAADVAVYGANFGRNVGPLAEPGAAFGGTGGGGNSAGSSYFAAIDGFFAGLGQEKKDKQTGVLGELLEQALDSSL